jgi:hypothetical protein
MENGLRIVLFTHHSRIPTFHYSPPPADERSEINSVYPDRPDCERCSQRPYDNEIKNVKKKNEDEIKFFQKNLTNRIIYLILHEIQLFFYLHGRHYYFLF